MISTWTYAASYVVTFPDKTTDIVQADQVDVQADGSLVFLSQQPGVNGPIYALAAKQWATVKRRE